MGGGSLIEWAGIGFHGRTDIVFIEGRLNARGYLALICEQPQRHGERIAQGNFVFQQDNAAIHTAKVVTANFQDNNIPVLTWPARSPDLNIIENLWACLARAVYSNGRQYSDVADLKTSLIQKWRELDQDQVKKLFSSSRKRMVYELENRGDSTKY